MADQPGSNDPWSKYPDAGLNSAVGNYDPWSKFPDAQPAKPTNADAVSEAVTQPIYGFNQGLNDVLSLPGNVMASGAEMLGVPKEYADKLRWNNQVSEALTNQPKPKTMLGRFANATGQAIGAGAIPEAGLMAKAGQVAGTARTAAQLSRPGAMLARDVLESTAADPAGSLAANTASAVAGATAQEGAKEAGLGPGWQVAAGLAGGMAPVPLSMAYNSVAQPIRRAFASQGQEGAYGKFAGSLNAPVDDVAEQIAVGARPLNQPNVDLANRTFDILGEEMERAGGNVQQAQRAVINRLVNEDGITPAAAAQRIRNLANAHADSDLFLSEYPSVSQSDFAQRNRRPGNIDLDELGRPQETQSQELIDYLANNGNTQSAQRTRNAVMLRQEGLADSMRDTIGDIGPQVPIAPGATTTRAATIADAQQMIEDATRAGSAAYRAAYNSPINNQASLVGVPQMLNWYENQIAGRGGDYASVMRRALDQFYIDVPPNPQITRQIQHLQDARTVAARQFRDAPPADRPALRQQLDGLQDQIRSLQLQNQPNRVPVLDLQHLQDARGFVRDMITEARGNGRNAEAAVLQPLYNRVTRIMEAMSDQWAQANRQWSDMNFLRIGEELGDALATKAGPLYRQQIQEFRNLAPEAQDIVRIHALQRMYDKLDNLNDTHAISKLWANDQSRDMIRQLFGEEAVVQFARAIRDQKVAEASQNMLRNSKTFRRGETKKQMETETGLVAATQYADAKSALKWIVEKALQIATEARNRHLSDIATTPMSNIAQVAQHFYRMRQGQSAMSRFANPPPRPYRPVGVIAPALSKLTSQ